MAHAQKPYFVFRWNGRVHLNLRGRQFSRLLAAEVCASAVVMLDTPCSEVVWRVLATHSIRQFPLHFPSRASPCDITFQLDSTKLSKSFVILNCKEIGTQIKNKHVSSCVFDCDSCRKLSEANSYSCVNWEPHACWHKTNWQGLCVTVRWS
jgi:hypothetical protein